MFLLSDVLLQKFIILLSKIWGGHWSNSVINITKIRKTHWNSRIHSKIGIILVTSDSTKSYLLLKLFSQKNVGVICQQEIIATFNHLCFLSHLKNLERNLERQEKSDKKKNVKVVWIQGKMARHIMHWYARHCSQIKARKNDDEWHQGIICPAYLNLNLLEIWELLLTQLKGVLYLKGTAWNHSNVQSQ